MALAMIAMATAAYSASGDKTSATKLPFHTISSSSKSACTTGEMRTDKNYVYVCSNYSTTVNWKRIAHGNAF